MSYEAKISQTKQIIDNHNKLAKNPIDYEKFVSNLQEAGGTTDETLKLCTWEDLEKFGLPTLVAKQVANAFRVKEKVITEAHTQAMTIRDLLGNFDPRDHTNFIGKRLIELAKDKPFLVYNEDGSINIDTSAKLLDELRDGYPARESVLIASRPYKVYSIGQRPDQLAFENPLYPGVLLRPDETCDHTNRSWGGISEAVRVLLYLAVKETKEIRVNSIDKAHSVMDFASTADAEWMIRSRYPKASLLYDDLKKEGKLPSLRLSRARSANDPFYNSHKRY